jgi:hypothetical protein
MRWQQVLLVLVVVLVLVVQVGREVDVCSHPAAVLLGRIWWLVQVVVEVEVGVGDCLPWRVRP